MRSRRFQSIDRLALKSPTADGREWNLRKNKKVARSYRALHALAPEPIEKTIFGSPAGVEHRFGHGPVEQSAVEMAQAVMGGEFLTECTLARCCGTVDGDDHVRSAPIERINSVKPGKLVAMKALSSIRT